MIVCLVMQMKVLNIDANASDMIMSMFSGIINLGIGAGALIGGKVILYMSLEGIGYLSAIFVLLSLLWILFLMKRYTAIR
ncbi:hypothetical protein HUO09_02660 [Vibrio sp. Y2-5]|uniref:hypothetical protein n=1 Tax=Vibrio sp. Y2-5 TaxID=2743977 RepID=UPI001660AC44|nr:hypothetical protein [Vibrio sp. Y2-5]MBD0785223.1 hypothetical protein [Vibrio sp. Y2-5]